MYKDAPQKRKTFAARSILFDMYPFFRVIRTFGALFAFVEYPVPDLEYERECDSSRLVEYGERIFCRKTEVERKSEERHREDERSGYYRKDESDNEDESGKQSGERRKKYAFEHAFCGFGLFFVIFFVFFSHDLLLPYGERVACRLITERSLKNVGDLLLLDYFPMTSLPPI